MHDLNRLVPVVVLGERREFLGRVCPVLGLAHEDDGDVGPNPGEIRVIAGDGRERKIGPSESKMESNHFTSPIEDSRRFETFRKSTVVVVENTWRSTPLGTLEVLGHINNNSGQIGLWSGAEHLTQAGQIGEDSERGSTGLVRSEKTQPEHFESGQIGAFLFYFLFFNSGHIRVFQ